MNELRYRQVTKEKDLPIPLDPETIQLSADFNIEKQPPVNDRGFKIALP